MTHDALLAVLGTASAVFGLEWRGQCGTGAVPLAIEYLSRSMIVG